MSVRQPQFECITSMFSHTETENNVLCGKPLPRRLAPSDDGLQHETSWQHTRFETAEDLFYQSKGTFTVFRCHRALVLPYKVFGPPPLFNSLVRAW